MRQKARLVLAFLVCLASILAPSSWAGWDPTKPVASSALSSGEIRNNWEGIGRSSGAVNALADNQFLVWAAGDAASPSYYTLSGAGATIARAGSGLGDTTRKWGLYSAKVTAGGGAAALFQQRLLTTTTYDDGFDGREVSAGAWVLCAGASAGRIQLLDGAGTTSSSYATAGSWTWLTVARTIDAAAAGLTWRFEVAVSQTCYVSGPTVVLGPVVPLYPMHSHWVTVTFSCFLAGNQSVGNDKAGCSWEPQRPGIVRDVQLRVKTAPATQSIIVDLNTWDGAAYTSMYSTRPQIAAAATRGGAAPDGTYARRCFTGQFGSTLVTGGSLSLDVDQVGSVTVGADLTVFVRTIVAARPLEGFLGYDEIN